MTLFAIADLATLKILDKKVDLSKSNIRFSNNDIRFLAFLTYYIFLKNSNIVFEKFIVI